MWELYEDVGGEGGDFVNRCRVGEKVIILEGNTGA